MMLSSRSPLSYLFFMLLALSMSPLVFTTANRIPRNKEHVPANTQDHVPRQLYRQTSREAIVMREEKRSRQRSGATRTGPEKRQTSQMAFPTSTDPSYTSTGFTPWAMYRNTDANGSSFRRVDGVNTREACHVLCQGDAGEFSFLFVFFLGDGRVPFRVVRLPRLT